MFTLFRRCCVAEKLFCVYSVYESIWKQNYPINKFFFFLVVNSGELAFFWCVCDPSGIFSLPNLFGIWLADEIVVSFQLSSSCTPRVLLNKSVLIIICLLGFHTDCHKVPPVGQGCWVDCHAPVLS